MTSVLSYRPSTSSTGNTNAPLNRQTSLSSFTSTRTASSPSMRSNGTLNSDVLPLPRRGSVGSSSRAPLTPQFSSTRQVRQQIGTSKPTRTLKSQYPSNSTEFVYDVSFLEDGAIAQLTQEFENFLFPKGTRVKCTPGPTIGFPTHLSTGRIDQPGIIPKQTSSI